MTTTQQTTTIKPKSTNQMQAVKCGCGILLGWTDGILFAVGYVSFSRVVTCKCAGCGKCRTWRPGPVEAA